MLVPDVFADNQFGQQRLDLGRPVAACAPTEKLIHPGPVDVDFFKCYEALGAPLNIAISWIDQFQGADVLLMEPIMFCNPAGMDGSPIQNPEEHLACFNAGPPAAPPGPVPVINQFLPEPFLLPLLDANAFCVPSAKQIVPPGTIFIIKDTVPDTPQNFAFSIDGGLNPPQFELDDDDDGALPNTQTFNDVPDGSYTVSEEPHPDYVTTVGCDDPDGGTQTSGTVLSSAGIGSVNPRYSLTFRQSWGVA